MTGSSAGGVGKRQWAILAVLTMVAFATNVDATIVVAALAKMTSGLHTSPVVSGGRASSPPALVSSTDAGFSAFVVLCGLA